MDKRTFLKSGFCATCGIMMGLIPFYLRSGTRAKPFHLPGEENKFSREAMHYISTPRGIKCKLCPQACDLKEGETGDCRTRVNKGGKLYTIAFGNPCAIHIDPIEKKPLNHFLPGSKSFSIATAGCNLACLNCQNWTISQESPLNTRNHELLPEDVVKQCKSYNCASIAYTYSEPIAFYEYTMESSKLARMSGIKNVFISAGYINEQPLREISKYLDAANIDLKSFSNEIYEMLNAGTIEPVLKTLQILKEENVWLEITNLVVPSWTDDMDMIKKMCHWLAYNGFVDTPLHFSRFHPTYKLKHLPPTPVETIWKARETALAEGLNFVYTGNIPESGSEDTYCPDCRNKIIGRKGYAIKEFHINNGLCEYCDNKIPGVWQ